MITQTIFEMLVADVFHLSDGRTVFAGKVLSGPSRIVKGHCRLLVAGAERASFDIEGELQFTPNVTGNRAVSTINSIPLDSDEIKRNPGLAVVLVGESEE